MHSRVIVFALVLLATGASAQTPQRRATNIAALAAFPTFYHGRQVVVVGQVSTDEFRGGVSARVKAASTLRRG